MTTIILVRHADSQGTEDAQHHTVPLFGGRMNDCPLGKKNGARQSKQLSEAWEGAGIKPDAIFSSIAKRAIGTAEPTAKKFGLLVHTVTDLQELSWGDWEGGPRSIQDEEPFRTQRWEQGFNFRPPGGESHNDVRARVLDALWEINSKGYECVLVFSHRNAIMNAVRDGMGWKTPAEQGKAVVDVCSATMVRFRTRGKLELIEFNKSLI